VTILKDATMDNQQETKKITHFNNCLKEKTKQNKPNQTNKTKKNKNKILTIYPLFFNLAS
jgi:hypothetical protein